MKKILIALLALSLIAFTASCDRKNSDNTETENNGITENTDKNGDENSDIDKNDSTDESENLEETAKEDKESTENKEQAEAIPVGDTYYYKGEAHEGSTFEIVGELLSSEYVIYTVDGEKYGICDMNAKVIVEPEFTLIGWCPWHEVVYAEPFPEGREPIVISDKFKIDLHYGHGGFGKSFYIFDNNTGRMFSGGTDIELIYLDEVTTVSVDTPYINYTGTSPLSEGDYYVGAENEDIYNLLESLVFGTAEYEFITSKGSIVSLGECEIADGFVNDYMLVKRNGKIGFVDLLGNDACEFKYTDAMRAFDSKAWVKSEDGKWKVVNLK